MIAAIFPSVPLLPNPPGINIPETFFNLFLISLGLKKSDSILTKFTLILFAIPPCVKASSSDLYASLSSTYFPIIAMFTLLFVFKTKRVIFFHGKRFTFFLDFMLKNFKTLSSSFSLLKLIGAS